jgi:hypothetical protein
MPIFSTGQLMLGTILYLFMTDMRLNASNVASQLTYGSRPRMQHDRAVTYEEMQEFVDMKIATAFGTYIHALDNHSSSNKVTKTYRTRNGLTFNLVAVPDGIAPSLITEEKCTFNRYKKTDPTGEIQLQLEGLICGAKLGILKIHHIATNTTTWQVIRLDPLIADNILERYMKQTLLPYFGSD